MAFNIKVVEGVDEDGAAVELENFEVDVEGSEVIELDVRVSGVSGSSTTTVKVPYDVEGVELEIHRVAKTTPLLDDVLRKRAQEIRDEVEKPAKKSKAPATAGKK